MARGSLDNHLIRNNLSSSSSSSTDHSIHSSPHQLQSNQNLVTSQLNVETTLSLYSVIGRAFLGCTRTSPELLEDENLTTVNGVGTVKVFSYNELAIATNYFNIYGEDEYGNGTVTKGWIDENTATATEFGRGLAVVVKRVYQGSNAKRRWLIPARLDYLAQLHHPNLVRLIGYCTKKEPRLLVCEFIHYGSLEEHFFKEDSQQHPWSLLVKVALGAAKGLAFLHNAETEVIHGNFKPSNILLDSNCNARLSDYGLARDSPPARIVFGDVHIGVDCLNGYTAPECQDSGDLTAKSDVYSFGVVLLEMLFSRRIVGNSRTSGVENIEVKNAKHCLNNKNRFFGVLKSCFKGQITLEDSQKAATLALKCLSMQADSRPTMNEVVTALEMIYLRIYLMALNFRNFTETRKSNFTT